MSKPKVYVTRQIPDEGMKLLYEKFDVYVNPHDRVVTREELLRDVRVRTPCSVFSRRLSMPRCSRPTPT